MVEVEEGKSNTNKIGLIIYFFFAVFMVVMAWGASWLLVPTFRYLSLDQVNQTIWSTEGILFFLWGMSIPLGSILAGVGMLIYVREKGSRILLFGLGVFIIGFLVGTLPSQNHYPPIFGVMGGLILAFFLAILWLWAKTRLVLEGPEKTAADFQLVSYIFFLVTAWQLCGQLGSPYLKTPFVSGSPVSISVYFAIGWLFLFLSHYKSRKQ
jgi:hypothetical protein